MTHSSVRPAPHHLTFPTLPSLAVDVGEGKNTSETSVPNSIFERNWPQRFAFTMRREQKKCWKQKERKKEIICWPPSKSHVWCYRPHSANYNRILLHLNRNIYVFAKDSVLHSVFLFFFFLISIVKLLSYGLETADGLVDPAVESRESGVNTGQVGPSAADAETDDAHLEPLAFFFADERPSSVSLLRPVRSQSKIGTTVWNIGQTQIQRRHQNKRKQTTYIAGVSSFCAGADGRGRQDEIRSELGP